MEAIHDSAVERRHDNLIYARSGTAWPYCLSMSAALPENMRGLAFGSAMVLLLGAVRLAKLARLLARTGRVLCAVLGLRVLNGAEERFGGSARK